MHASLTLTRIVAAIRRSMRDDSYPGFCTTCGRKAKQFCEPDASGYTCQYKSCGKPTVYGAEQLLLMTHA